MKKIEKPQSSHEQSNLLIVEQNKCLKVQRGNINLNERFKPYANRPSKPLKQWCKEWGIAPYLRRELVCFYTEDNLFAIYDGRLKNSVTIKQSNSSQYSYFEFSLKLTPQ